MNAPGEVPGESFTLPPVQPEVLQALSRDVTENKHFLTESEELIGLENPNLYGVLRTLVAAYSGGNQEATNQMFMVASVVYCGLRNQVEADRWNREALPPQNS